MAPCSLSNSGTPCTTNRPCSAWLQDEEEGQSNWFPCVTTPPDKQGTLEGERIIIKGKKQVPNISAPASAIDCEVAYYWHNERNPVDDYNKEDDELTVYYDEYGTGWYKEEDYAIMNKVLIQSFGLEFGHITDCLLEEIKLKAAEKRVDEFFGEGPVSTDLNYLFKKYYLEYCKEYSLYCSGSGLIETVYPEDIILDLGTAIIAKQGGKYIFRLYRLLRKEGRKVAIEGTKILDDAGEVLFEYTDEALKSLKMIPDGGEVLGITDNVVKFTDEAGNIVETKVQLITKNGKLGFRKVVEAGIKSWDDAVAAVDELIKPQISKLKAVYPDVKMGYRGSLATGKKFSTGGLFDPSDWDVDAFIVSDDLAKKIGGSGFRNGRDIAEISPIADELEAAFKNLSGYRTEVGKPFTFRVWTQTEFDKIVKPNGYKLFE